jgi:hypothetical protein
MCSSAEAPLTCLTHLTPSTDASLFLLSWAPFLGWGCGNPRDPRPHIYWGLFPTGRRAVQGETAGLVCDILHTPSWPQDPSSG